MSDLSPLQQVREDHGSKEELVDKLLDEVLEPPEDEAPLDFEERIASASNKKLLRLWDAHQTVLDEFGSKQALVDKLVTSQFPGGNADYADKLSGMTLPRLLGLARDNDLI